MSKLIRPALLLPVLCFLGFCFAGHAPAQAPSAAAKASPAPLVPPPPSYPLVAPDGTATFHLQMPDARKVVLDLEGKHDPIPMARDDSGDWSVAVPDLAPEFYSYSFEVDGTRVLDPHNTTIKTSFFSNDNVFLVPGHPAMPWEEANVPHGVVDHHYYHSDIVVGLGKGESQYFVYTPPGYDPRSNTKYPVLYLLHGYSDEPSAWTAMGKANIILDNLIAQGKAKPMIVVMPWGYGDMHMITDGWAAWRDPSLVMANFSKFGDAVFKEVMPRVNAEYPISGKREDHAIAGLSMGGAETLIVGLNHTDYFGSIGSFSAGGIGGDHFEPLFPAITPQTGPRIQSSLKLFWVACGTEDGLNEPNQNFIAWLRRNGLQPTAVHTPGAHVWMVWRDNLSKFAPLLFQN